MKESSFVSRYGRFGEELRELNLDGFLITHPANLFYLHNLRASAGVSLCFYDEALLWVDSRYFEAASSQAVNCRVELITGSFELSVIERLRAHVGSPRSERRLGIESRRLSCDFYLRLRDSGIPVEWRPVPDLIERLRAVKDASEQAILRQAFVRAQKAHSALEPQIRVGMTEREVAGCLELELRRRGGEGTAFDTIVASGARSSLPHAMATDRRLRADDLLLIDFGMRYRGYCTDLTRVHVLAGNRLPEIAEIVQEAQKAALDRIRPGVEGGEIDSAAREVIRKHGYGEFFGHSTGHGIGLEVHEFPHLSPHRSERLQTGMVFTVEPGIYLPGSFGIRLEDVVVVTTRGCSLLSRPQF